MGRSWVPIQSSSRSGCIHHRNSLHSPLMASFWCTCPRSLCPLRPCKQRWIYRWLAEDCQSNEHIHNSQELQFSFWGSPSRQGFRAFWRQECRNHLPCSRWSRTPSSSWDKCRTLLAGGLRWWKTLARASDDSFLRWTFLSIQPSLQKLEPNHDF